MKKIYIVACIFASTAIAIFGLLKNKDSPDHVIDQPGHEAVSTLRPSRTHSDSNEPLSVENNNHNQIHHFREHLMDIYNKYKNSRDQDERLHLTASLAAMAENVADHNENAALLKLKGIATQDEDKEVRSYAVMSYSRIANADQAIELLKMSLSNGTVGYETYYSELARVYFRFELPEDRSNSILDEITSFKNKYTAEVIFSTISQTNPTLTSPAQKEKLQAYLQENFPTFPTRFTSLGISDTLAYTDWIQSMAVLATGTHDREAISGYLLKYFEKGFRDPREAVSLALSAPFWNLDGSNNAMALRKIVWEETMKYAASYPNNPVIQTLGIAPEDYR